MKNEKKKQIKKPKKIQINENKAPEGRGTPPPQQQQQNKIIW